MDGAIIASGSIGMVCLAASFFLKDDKQTVGVSREKLEEEIRGVISDDETMKEIVSQAGERMHRAVEEELSELIATAKDELSESSNTKMMALSEMSDQIFAKMEENHKEVVFLYDMLNEKSEALKDFSAKIEGMKKQFEDNEKKISYTTTDNGAKKEMSEAAGKQKKKGEKGEKRGQASKGKKERSEKKMEPKGEKEETLSSNEKILAMHRDGKSVMEISKELRIGQGEVSLILGLYADKN